MARRYNPRIAKTSRCYTTDEVAELYACHRNTVANWVKRGGLKPINNHIPFLFHGAELNDFHAPMRASTRKPCRPDELYCMKCRAPSALVSETISIVPNNRDGGAVAGNCVTCDHRMFQQFGAARLGALQAAIRQKCTVELWGLVEIRFPLSHYASGKKKKSA